MSNALPESASHLSSVLTRLQRAQDRGIMERTDISSYKESIGHIYDRMESIRRNNKQHELQRLFGHKINSLSSPTPDQHASSIFESLYEQVFDAGTNREVTCTIPGEHVPFNAKPALVHSRASLINNVVEKLESGIGEVQIGLIDLKDLRSADFPVPGEKHNPADVIINKAAHAIQNGLLNAWSDPKTGIDPALHSFELGRYGGDEFIFSLHGQFTPEQKDLIMRHLEESLGKEQGYYKRITRGEQTIERDRLRLKSNSEGKNVEWISFPEDEKERKMYMDYFKRGLLLNRDEFMRIKKKYITESGRLNFEEYQRDYIDTLNYYPTWVGTMQQKINYIQTHHPEFALYFDLARLYDAEEGVQITTRQERVLRTIERSIFDPLLGEAIYSRFDFQRQYEKGEFSEVILFDLKFMKEMNEGMTYADADAAIVTFWRKIKNAIELKDERGKLIVSRAGGTFMIGVKKDQSLSGETNEAIDGLLKQPTTLYKDEANTDVKAPISATRYKVGTQKDFKSLLQFTDRVFFTNLLEDLKAKETETPDFMSQILAYPIGESSSYHPMSIIELYARYLRGKRSLERVTGILDIAKQRLSLVASDRKLRSDTHIAAEVKIEKSVLRSLETILYGSATKK